MHRCEKSANRMRVRLMPCGKLRVMLSFLAKIASRFARAESRASGLLGSKDIFDAAAQRVAAAARVEASLGYYVGRRGLNSC